MKMTTKNETPIFTPDSYLLPLAHFIENKVRRPYFGTKPVATVFDQVSPFEICRTHTVKGFVEYLLHTFGACDPICFVVAMIYLERWEHYSGVHQLGPQNFHRAFYTAFLLAIKSTQDVAYHRFDLVTAVNIPAPILADMEWTLSEGMQFHFEVSEEDLLRFLIRVLTLHDDVGYPLGACTLSVSPVLHALPQPLLSTE